MITFFYSKPIFLFFIAIIFYVSSLIIIKYRKNYNKKPVIENTSKFQKEFFVYLDKYYINNKFYTFFAVTFYIIAQTGWVLIYRIFLIYNKNNNSINRFLIEYDDFSLDAYNLFLMMIFIILLLITIVLFKIMLDNLFHAELIKLHIFFLQYNSYCTLKSYLIASYFIDFFGKGYLFFYNLNKLRDYHDDSELVFYPFYEYKYIYENKLLKKWSTTILIFIKKNKAIYVINSILMQMFRWLHYNMRFDGFACYIPYIFFAAIMIFSITKDNIYCNTYLFFLCYSLILLTNYLKFLSKRDYVYDGILSTYFYENSLNYKKQRIWLKKNMHQFHDNMYDSDENKSILHYMKNFSEFSFIYYVLQDCIISETSEQKKYMKYFKASHKRYYIFCTALLVTSYVILHKDKYSLIILYKMNLEFSILYIIILAIILMFYFVTNIFKSPKHNIYDSHDEYIYNPKYRIIFWFLVIFFIYIFYLLIIKANLFILSDNILWEYSGIKFYRNYSIEDKTKYFWEFFNHISNYRLSIDDKNYLENIINLLNLNHIITDEITLIEIKKFIVTVIELYKKSELLEFYCIYSHILYTEEVEIYYENLRNSPINELIHLIVVHTLISFFEKHRKIAHGIKAIKFVKNHIWIFKKIIKLIFNKK